MSLKASSAASPRESEPSSTGLSTGLSNGLKNSHTNSNGVKLPPKTSPTLPAWADNVIPDMLSPTLPDTIEQALTGSLSSSSSFSLDPDSDNSGGNLVPKTHKEPRKEPRKESQKESPKGLAISGTRLENGKEENRREEKGKEENRIEEKDKEDTDSYMVKLKMPSKPAPPGPRSKSTSASTSNAPGGSKLPAKAAPVSSKNIPKRPAGEPQKRTSLPPLPPNVDLPEKPALVRKKPAVSNGGAGSHSHSHSNSHLNINGDPSRASTPHATTGSPSVGAKAVTNKKRHSQASVAERTESRKKKKFDRSYSSSEDDDDDDVTTPSQSHNKNQKSQRPPPTPDIKRSGPNTDTNTAESNAKPVGEKREKFYRLLRSKMHNWVDIAGEKKHDSDKALQEKDYKLAQVISMDSLFAFIVGFDYEDRGELMMKREPGTKSWSSLSAYLTRVIRIFEAQKNDDFLGIAYYIRALISLKIASRLLKIVNKEPPDSTKELTKDFYADTKQVAYCQDSAAQDFLKASQILSMETIQDRYPAVWKNRSVSPQPPSKREGGYRPMEDPYYLPLHMFSSLQEAAAFGYAVTKAWADKNAVTCDWALVKGLR